MAKKELWLWQWLLCMAVPNEGSPVVQGPLPEKVYRRRSEELSWEDWQWLPCKYVSTMERAWLHAEASCFFDACSSFEGENLLLLKLVGSACIGSVWDLLSNLFCPRILDNLPVAEPRFRNENGHQLSSYERGFPVGRKDPPVSDLSCIWSPQPALN